MCDASRGTVTEHHSRKAAAHLGTLFYPVTRYIFFSFVLFFRTKLRSKKGEWSKGGIPAGIKSKWGYRQIRPRNALPRAPARVKSNYDLARCPQPMPSTRNFCFFFRARCWGEQHRRAGGVKKIPFPLHVGGECPATLLNSCISPRDHHFSPLDRNRAPS